MEFTRCPSVRGPRDVPDLRGWLAQEWAPGRAFANSAYLQVEDEEAPTRIAGRNGEHAIVYSDAAIQISSWNLRMLYQSQLWWVDAEMVDLLEASCQDLPSTTLTDELVPVTHAFVVFERPLQGFDARTGLNSVRVDGIMWAPQIVEGSPCISATLYTRINIRDFEALRRRYPEEFKEEEWATLAAGVREDELWATLGRTDWRFGDDWSAALPGIEEEAMQISQREDRRWLLTLWALATQPNISTQREDHGSRPERRRAERLGHPAPTVTIVNLRRSVYTNAGASRTQTGKRTYHVRWPVRGHWRNQAYGPGHSLRRPVFIAAHFAGPEDAPLKKGARVHVLRKED